MSKGNPAIVGFAEVPTSTYPHRFRWDILHETCTQAVGSSGLHKDDIEAVITVAPQAQARPGCISNGNILSAQRTTASLR